ncbi:uncharacterized protein LOC127261556 [Andrographis paniculata]|uniref:uncharacterized protein LOC127261556 n=1 Tax=Andrographis paniculata TaxID=175694 RepID=UPI0021E71213|nr:uncharacterized protein LOC127261556 [Andrographis paniculata]
MGQPYSTSTNGQHKGRSTTFRNQQYENLVRNSPFPYWARDSENGWDNKHPSRLDFGY